MFIETYKSHKKGLKEEKYQIIFLFHVFRPCKRSLELTPTHPRSKYMVDQGQSVLLPCLQLASLPKEGFYVYFISALLQFFYIPLSKEIQHFLIICSFVCIAPVDVVYVSFTHCSNSMSLSMGFVKLEVDKPML